MSEQNSLVYSVLIIRKDSEIIEVDKTKDFKESEKLWEELHNKWQEAHKEGIPYVLKKPEITAFEPGLIKEIKIVAMQSGVENVDMNNPYMQKMMKNGFSSTFPNQGRQQGIDILDQGSIY